MEEDYEDEYDEEDELLHQSERLVLSIGKNGKAELHKPDEYVQILKKEFKLIRGFIEKNQKEFNKYAEENKERIEND